MPCPPLALAGALGNELLSREREATLEIAIEGRPWKFDGDGGLFRLLSEAHRISLADLFDPLLAVHTSLVELADPSAGSPEGRVEVTPEAREQARELVKVYFAQQGQKEE
jgi:hypothetical protein